MPLAPAPFLFESNRKCCSIRLDQSTILLFHTTRLAKYRDLAHLTAAFRANCFARGACFCFCFCLYHGMPWCRYQWPLNVGGWRIVVVAVDIAERCQCESSGGSTRGTAGPHGVTGTHNQRQNSMVTRNSVPRHRSIFCTCCCSNISWNRA